MLTTQYSDSKLHGHTAGQKIKTSVDRSNDFISIGADNLERLRTISEWFKCRTHPRSTAEDWGPEPEIEPLMQIIIMYDNFDC